MEEIRTAFEDFRRGLFLEARSKALRLIERNPKDYWATYLAALSSAFAQEIREFEKYLIALTALAEEEPRLTGEEKVYEHYLKAYYSLLAHDTEKALWYYLELAKFPEGWLARALVKKFRKIREIENLAFRVADFVVLPAELPPHRLPLPRLDTPFSLLDDQERKSGGGASSKAAKGWLFKPHRRFALKFRLPPFFLNWRYAAFTVAFLFLALTLWGVWRVTREKSNIIEIPPLQVAQSASVMPVDTSRKIHYKYKARSAIIEDFEAAKRLLAARKINQSRYTLERLIHSNADFQTREKAKVFLGFIPDLPYTEFNDNLRIVSLIHEPKLRQGSLILTSGELRDAKKEAGGTTYQFIASEEGKEFKVSAFLPATVQEEKSNTKSPSVQVYGRFKGLVGEQRTVYLEALRVWR